MKKLKAIRVKSVAVVSVVLGAALGSIVGLGFLISDILDHQYVFGLLTFVLAPILYGLLFALGNAFMAWVYNRVAERFGGIEISLED